MSTLTAILGLIKNADGDNARAIITTDESANMDILESILTGADAVKIPNAALAGGIVASVREYGAVGDGIADDTAAVVAALAALDNGDTLLIPTGIFRITSGVSSTKSINIVGNGMGSVLLLDVGPAADGLTVAPAADYLYSLKWRDFSILGAADSCRNGLVLGNVNNSYFENIPVRAGAAAGVDGGYGVWLRDFGICNHYEFVLSINASGYPVPCAMPATGAIKASAAADAACTSNANIFDCIIEGGAGKGLYIVTSGDNGNNTIMGTYEGCGGHALHIKGGRRAWFRDLHLESTAAGANYLVVDGHAWGRIGPRVLVVAFQAADTDVQLIDSDSTIVDGVVCNHLSIDAASDQTEIRLVTFSQFAGSGVADAGTNTRHKQDIVRSDPAAVSGAATTLYQFLAASGAEMWLASANIGTIGDAINYGTAAIIAHDGNTTRVVVQWGATAPFPGISVTGLDVQVTQSSGVATPIRLWMQRLT